MITVRYTNASINNIVNSASGAIPICGIIALDYFKHLLIINTAGTCGSDIYIWSHCMSGSIFVFRYVAFINVTL